MRTDHSGRRHARTRKAIPNPLPETQAAEKSAFLEAFRMLGVIRQACDASNVCRQTVYTWKKADPDFARDFADALDDFHDTIEQEAMRRAFEGVDEPIVGRIERDKDGIVCTVRKYSDRLAEKILSGRRPEL